MVRFSAVGLRYPEGRGAWALQGLDFLLPTGSFTWLLGPSGAGKTSVLGLMHLRLRPTSGRVEVMEQDPAREPVPERPVVAERTGQTAFAPRPSSPGAKVRAPDRAQAATAVAPHPVDD